MFGFLFQWKLFLLLTSLWFGNIATLENLALGKQAYQSGTAWGGVASRAVDGGLSQGYYDGSCTHTSGSLDQYWEVDLGRTYTIDHVTIYNRLDAGAYRTRDIEIYIGTQQDKYHLEVFHEGQIDPIHTFHLPSSVTGRWVRITRLPTVQDFFNVCEVQVYGTPFEYFRIYPSLMGNGPLLQSENAKTPVLCGYICWKDIECVTANYRVNNNQCDLLSSNSNQTSVEGIMLIA